MEFAGISNETLNANLTAIKGMSGMDAMINAIRAELDTREANAVREAQSAALRDLADKASATMAACMASPVTAVSDPNGAIMKHAARTLRELIMVAHDFSSLKAQRAIMVLADRSGQTDSDGTVAYAVDYVTAHATSTVYRTADKD